jgi:DNA-binding NtrC family response regulator
MGFCMRWHWPHHRESSRDPNHAAHDGSALQPARVLVLADDRKVGGEIAGMLQSVGHWVRCVSSVKAALAATLTTSFEILIVSPLLPDGTAHDLLREVRARYPVRAIALVTSPAGEAVKADPEFVGYLKSPLVPEHVLSVMATASVGIAHTSKPLPA